MDDSGVTGILRILLIIGVIAMIILLGFLIIAAEGNPFADKTYVEADVNIGPALAKPVKIDGVSHRAVQKSYVDTYGFWDWVDPTDIQGNVEVTLTAQSDGGTWTQVDKKAHKFDVGILDGWSGTYSFDLGPLPDDATSYRISVQLIKDDGTTIDSTTRTGDV